MEASNFYLALSFKFASQSINRPNFAKKLRERAKEEMSHATMLANFQLSRGGEVDVIFYFLRTVKKKVCFQIKEIAKPSIGVIKTMNDAFNAMIETEETLTQGPDALK